MKLRRKSKSQGAAPSSAESNGAAPAPPGAMLPEHRANRAVWYRLALVMAVALGLYLRSTNFGLVYLDDDLLIVDEQSQLAEPSSAWRAFARPYFAKSSRDHAYYRPMASASYVLDAQLSGASASSFHRTNCLIHAATAGLLFFWLLSLGCGKNTALFGGLVFAAHPALCEAVAWIPGRPDLLMTLFVLLAWLCLLKAHDNRAWLIRTCHLLAWLLALLSKEAAIVLPLVWWLSGRLVSGRPLSRSAAPWMVWGWGGMGLLYLLARSMALSGELGTSGVTVTGILSNAAVLLSSLGKLLIPIQLSVLAIPEDTWVWPGLVVLGALGAAYHARWLGRARALFATIAYVLLMLPSLPASSHLILENRLYLPATILIWLVCSIAEDVGLRGSFKSVAASAVIVSLVWRTNAYLEAFRERRSFAEAAVQGSPHSAYARKILGVTLHLAGDTEGAFRAYQDALDLDGSEPVAHNNLGVIFMARGDLVQAERELRKELEINPDYAEAQQNLAMVLHALGRSD